MQGFVPTVLATTNQSVTWQIQGAACSVSGACGTIDFSGAYTAPWVAPTPSNLQVLAVSQADQSQGCVVPAVDTAFTTRTRP